MSSLSSKSPHADTGHAGDGLSVSQAAAYLGLSDNAVRHEIRRGTLPAVKVNGEWRVRLVEALLPTAAARPRTGDAAATPEDRSEALPPAHPVAAQHQLEVIRDTLLRPLIEQNERQQSTIMDQAQTIGRLTAEREQARLQAEIAALEREQIEAERDVLQRRLAELTAIRHSSQDTLALTAIEASDAPRTATHAATSARQKPRQRRWWLRLFGVDE